MAYSPTTPLDSANRGDGAGELRDWKAAIQTALATDGIFPGPNTAVPVFIHKFKTGNTAARPTAGNTGRWYYNSQTQTIQRDNGSTWDNLTAPVDIIPLAQKMIFYNVAAPVGWTQSAAYDDLTLRSVVGAGGGTGGTDSIISPPTHNHTGNTGQPDVNLSHAHTTNTTVSLSFIVSPFVLILATSQIMTTTGTTDSNHTHVISNAVEFTPRYIDVIVCYR